MLDASLYNDTKEIVEHVNSDSNEMDLKSLFDIQLLIFLFIPLRVDTPVIFHAATSFDVFLQFVT